MEAVALMAELEAFPEPRPEMISCTVQGVLCQISGCGQEAEHHEFGRLRELHYCSQHAALYLIWYLDDYDRVAAGLPSLTTQRESITQELLQSEGATRTALEKETARVRI
jgi:hypothetical protein